MKEISPKIATTLLKKLAAGIALGTFLLTSPITIVPQKAAYAEAKQEEKKEQSELEKKIDAALETYNLGVKLDDMYAVMPKDENLQTMLNTLKDNSFREFVEYIKEEHKEKKIADWEIRDFISDYDNFDSAKKILERKGITEEKSAIYDLYIIQNFCSASYIPWDIFKNDHKKLTKITRFSSMGPTLSSIPVNLWAEHSDRLVEIAKLAEWHTRSAYTLISLSQKMLSDEQIKQLSEIETWLSENSSNHLNREKEIIQQREEMQAKIISLIKSVDDSLLPCEQTRIPEELEHHEKIIDYISYGKVISQAEKAGFKDMKTLKHILIGNETFKKMDKWLRDNLHNKNIRYSKEAEEFVRYVNCAANFAKQDNKIFEDYIRGKLGYPTYLISELINLTWDKPKEQEKIVNSLDIGTIYLLLSSGFTDSLYPSSFNILYHKLSYQLGNGKGFLKQDEENADTASGKALITGYICSMSPDNRLNKNFLLAAATFGKLNEIIGIDEERDKLLKEFLSAADESKEMFFRLSPATISLFSSSHRDVLEKEILSRYNSSNNYQKTNYGLLAYAARDAFRDKDASTLMINDALTRLGISVSDLEMKIPESMYPYNSVFKLYFSSEYDDNKNYWHIDAMKERLLSANYTIKEKSTKGSMRLSKKSIDASLEFLLVPVNVTRDKKKIISSDTELLSDIEDDSIILVGHRGHAFQVDQLIKDSIKIKDTPYQKIIFLGSCAGFKEILYRAEPALGSNMVYISSQNSGIGEVNDYILIELAGVLAEKPEVWAKATKMLKERFLKNYPKLAKSFSDYSFPSELPSLVLKYGE